MRRTITVLAILSVACWIATRLPTQSTYESFALVLIPKLPINAQEDIANRLGVWRDVGLSDSFLLDLIHRYHLYPNLDSRGAIMALRSRSIFIRKVSKPENCQLNWGCFEIGFKDRNQSIVNRVASDVIQSVTSADLSYAEAYYSSSNECSHADCSGAELIELDRIQSFPLGHTNLHMEQVIMPKPLFLTCAYHPEPLRSIPPAASIATPANSANISRNSTGCRTTTLHPKLNNIAANGRKLSRPHRSNVPPPSSHINTREGGKRDCASPNGNSNQTST